MEEGQFVWMWQVGVASKCEIRGVGRLMMVGMVMIAVLRVVDPVIFSFNIANLHFRLQQIPLHSYTTFYRFK